MPTNRRSTLPDAPGQYRIDVENFGPIARAAVDLRPLTIFVGPSNTGKSYLAMLIYALHRAFGSVKNIYGIQWDPERGGGDSPPAGLDPAVFSATKDWLRTASRQDPMPALPDAVMDYLRQQRHTDELDRFVAGETRLCYGVTRLGDLVRREHAADGARLDLTAWSCSKTSTGAPPAHYQFRFGEHDDNDGGGDLSDVEPLTEPFSRHFIKRFLLHPARRQVDEDDVMSLLASAMQNAFSKSFPPLFRPVHYLPSDRSGLMRVRRVMMQALLGSAARAGQRPSTPMITGITADFLNRLLTLDDKAAGRAARQPRPVQQRNRPNVDLAKHLERAVLRGAIELVDTEIGYTDFVYRPTGWPDVLPLLHASSMVTELAPLVLHLRYFVFLDDVIIIEEPEAGLHPAAQARFARELARMVHAGIRIIITTHSDWFLEQIGNLVRLSELPEDRRAGLDGADVSLRPQQVGTWLFRRNNRLKGSVVKEAKLDSETGLYPVGYDDVGEALYNQSAKIFNRLPENNRQ